MRWEDERYVRLYTRDTVDWNMWPWQSRALFPLILRKVDRAGLLVLGRHGVRGLADLVKLPVEVVEPGLVGLVEDGCVDRQGDMIVIRSFIEAQECASTDAQRKRDERERARAKASNVTNRDIESQNSTKSHEQSHGVTDSHSVPSLSVPSRTQKKEPSANADHFVLGITPEASPLPFSVDSALEALAAGGRFVKSKISKGQAVNVNRLIRQHPEPNTWTLVGQWLQAGGESWRQHIDVRALRDFSAWVEHAKRWEADGRKEIANRQPTHSSAPPAPRKTKTFSVLDFPSEPPPWKETGERQWWHDDTDEKKAK